MNIKLVTNSDDWEGLYVDGKLVVEGHKISLREFANAVGVDFDRVEVFQEWLGGEVSSLPMAFNKIPKKYIVE